MHYMILNKNGESYGDWRKMTTVICYKGLKPLRMVSWKKIKTNSKIKWPFKSDELESAFCVMVLKSLTFGTVHIARLK